MDTSARLTMLTRLGFAARGLLYIVIAVLVISSGRTEDPSGALRYLATGSTKWLLVLLAAGFVAYGLWRLSDALFNIEGHERGLKGTRERIGAGGSGIVHLFLAWQAVWLMQGGSGSGGGSGLTASTPLIIAGLVLLGVGAFQLVKAAKASFCKNLDASVADQPWVKGAGQLGYAARGLVFLISGYFFVRAGLDGAGGQAGGMDRALTWLSSPWDVVVAVGLLLFGIFSLIEARYRRIHAVSPHDMARQVRA